MTHPNLVESDNVSVTRSGIISATLSAGLTRKICVCATMAHPLTDAIRMPPNRANMAYPCAWHHYCKEGRGTLPRAIHFDVD
jgi:hypothetical protein